MKKVVVVQPYLPTYRKTFFNLLSEKLRTDSIELVLAAGLPDGEQAARNDSSPVPGMVALRNRFIKVGDRRIVLGSSYPHWRSADALIVGHVGSSVESNLAVAAAKVSRLKVGVWGHMRSYVSPSHPLDAAVERAQMRLADHVFAYTPSGSQYAVDNGVDPEKVTTVMNSVDTIDLEKCRERIISEAAVPNLFQNRPTYAFIGGVDSSKRIKFLSESLELLWKSNPNIQLLMAGTGSDTALLEPAVRRGQVQLLGYADSEKKAWLLHHSRGILMPGRIGLVAVDALVMRSPILTTNWDYHAPEADYLVEGISRISSEDTVSAYAAMVLKHATRSFPTHTTDAEWAYPTMGDMVNNFRLGVKQLLG